MPQGLLHIGVLDTLQGGSFLLLLFLTVNFHSSHDYYTITIKSKLNVLYDHMTSQQQNFANEHYTCGTPGALQVC